jgi:hypothetical protein
MAMPASPSVERRPGFVRKQYEFAAHIRDPEKQPRPADVEDRRMAIYRNLFYNNVEGFVSGGFPVLRKLYDDADWHRMVRDFFARHRSHTPYFLEIAQEFLRYLEHDRDPQPEDPPFLGELAHYEWVELALSVSDEEPNWEAIDDKGDPMSGRPALSPLAWLLSYQYPVHEIGPEFIPDAPGEQPTYLMVYRDAGDEIGFMALNPVTARLIALIQEFPQETGEQQLGRIADELHHPNPELVIEGGKQIFVQMKHSDIVLGTYKE